MATYANRPHLQLEIGVINIVRSGDQMRILRNNGEVLEDDSALIVAIHIPSNCGKTAHFEMRWVPNAGAPVYPRTPADLGAKGS